MFVGSPFFEHGCTQASKALYNADASPPVLVVLLLGNFVAPQRRVLGVGC